MKPADREKRGRKSCVKFCDTEVKTWCFHTADGQQQLGRGKMARRCGRATSRFTGEIQIYPRKIATPALWLCFCLLFPSAAEAGLYTASDQVIVLSPENVDSVLINSSAAILAEFYASWCGHCIAFSPVYKSLARDIKGWYRPAASHVAAAVYNGN